MGRSNFRRLCRTCIKRNSLPKFRPVDSASCRPYEPPMLKSIGNFFSSVLAGWVFSAQGIAVCGIVGGAIMAFLTYLTKNLDGYSPLSYGVAAVFGIISIIIILRSLIAIYIAFNEQMYTKKPTYIEYRMEQGRINLVSKSNIWGEPAFALGIHLEQSPAAQANSQRNQRRLEKKHPVKVTEHELKTGTIHAVFDRPIAPKSFHVHLVKGVGKCPVRMASNIHSRGASVELNEITNDCSFQVWFSEERT